MILVYKGYIVNVWPAIILAILVGMCWGWVIASIYPTKNLIRFIMGYEEFTWKKS